MDTSQRCAKPIYTFANNLMENYPKSFYKNIMKGTEFNPKTQAEVSIKTFEEDLEEKNFILDKIKNIFKTDKNASVAILLRNNYQVENYGEFLAANKIKITEKIDNLKNDRVFNVILTYFEILEFPYNNKILSDGIKNLCKYGLYKITEEETEKLKNLKESFLLKNPDEFDCFELSKFWWDFDYIFSNSNQEPDFLTCLIADYYFKSQTELENAYMLALMIKKMSQNTKSEQNIIEKLKTVKNLSNLGFIHLIKDSEKKETQNSVEIMTIHKSKGDEFDYVFVPEMSSKLFSVNAEDIKISTENHFCECLKPKEKRRTINELKKEQADETLRLIYVAITRAKKELFLSFSKSQKLGSKNLSPCEVLNLQNKCRYEIEDSY